MKKFFICLLLFLSTIVQAKDGRSLGKQFITGKWVDKDSLVLTPGQPKIVSLYVKLDTEDLLYHLASSEGLLLRPLSLPRYQKGELLKLDIELLTQTAGRYYIHLYLEAVDGEQTVSSVMSRVVISEGLDKHPIKKLRSRQEFRILPAGETRITVHE